MSLSGRFTGSHPPRGKKGGVCLGIKEDCEAYLLEAANHPGDINFPLGPARRILRRIRRGEKIARREAVRRGRHGAPHATVPGGRIIGTVIDTQVDWWTPGSPGLMLGE